jgi:cytochrome c-type biogenesis protein CcmH
MIFWLAVLALSAGSVWFLLRPVLREGNNSGTREAFALDVYRNQLAEMEREAKSGALTPEEAEAMRAEIGRRALAAANEASKTDKQRRFFSSKALAGAIGVAVPALSVLTYLWLGSPSLPGQPLAARENRGGEAMAQAPHDLATMALRLAERLAREPNDVQGWTMLGRSYLFLDRYPEAVDALRRAVELSGGNAEIKAIYLEAVVSARGGVIDATALELIEAVLKELPGDPRARFFRATALEQKGDGKAALEELGQLVALGPPDAPWLQQVRARIEVLARRLNVDPPRIAAAPPQGAGSGFVPAPAAAEAVMAMPPEQREAFMRNRIEALAERLRQEPGDIEGWLRLVRSYSVLGEAAKARAAIDSALTASANAGPAAREAVLAAARQLGIEPNAVGGTAVQAATVAAAPAIPREAAADRESNARLAARLESNSDDPEALRKIARAFAARGDAAKAREILARATLLKPEDLEILSEFAEATIAAAGGERVPPEAVALYSRVLLRNGGHPDALWYLGLAASQANDRIAAAEYWGRLSAQLPAGSRERSDLESRLQRLKSGP